MSFRDKQVINVLNYNNFTVVVSTRDQSYVIEPSEDGTPSKMSFSPSEVEVINSNSNVFKIGTLRFEEFEQEEVYTSLRIMDWASILTNEEIEQIILHPTYEGLKKIVSIKNQSLFERVRGIYTCTKNDPTKDIYGSVERIIDTRYRELLNGITKSEIVLKQTDTEQKDTESSAALVEENESLKSEVTELKKMVEKLLSQNGGVAGNEPLVEEVKPVRRTAKKTATTE